MYLVLVLIAKLILTLVKEYSIIEIFSIPLPSCLDPLSYILTPDLRAMRMCDHLVLIGIPKKVLQGLIEPDIQHL